MPHRLLPGALLLALCCAAACGKANAEGESKKVELPAPLVRAAAAELRQVRREIRTTGFLESEQNGSIASLVAGRVRSLHVDQGARVTAGQLLAELDDREARSALQQLTVQRDAKKLDAELAKLEIEAAERRVAQASFEAQKARAEFDRQKQTLPEFVAPKALQDSELAWQSAAEAVEVAKFNASKARLEVQRIGTTVDELQARIDETAVRLDHHRITAPFAGVVTMRHVSVGATVGSATKLFDMVDPDRLVAWLDRPQSELDLVQKSKVVTFTTDALQGREFTADVDLVSPVVDRATGHFRLRMRVRKDDSKSLVHGMFVRARILAEDLREALLVPKGAVLSEGDTSVVMVARGGKAFRVDLDPGLELDDWIECKNRGSSGVQPGEMVIVAGHEDLEDQAAVRLQQ